MPSDEMAYDDLFALYEASWSVDDRHTVRRLLGAVEDRAGPAYQAQSYCALKPAGGAPRVPLYVGSSSVSVDRDILLPEDLDARAVPERRGSHYAKIHLSSSKGYQRAAVVGGAQPGAADAKGHIFAWNPEEWSWLEVSFVEAIEATQQTKSFSSGGR